MTVNFHFEKQNLKPNQIKLKIKKNVQNSKV